MTDLASQTADCFRVFGHPVDPLMMLPSGLSPRHSWLHGSNWAPPGRICTICKGRPRLPCRGSQPPSRRRTYRSQRPIFAPHFIFITTRVMAAANRLPNGKSVEIAGSRDLRQRLYQELFSDGLNVRGACRKNCHRAQRCKAMASHASPEAEDDPDSKPHGA